jgi:hypothetical protein
MSDILDSDEIPMSSLFDISCAATYPFPMFKSRVTHMVHGIERFLDLLPEPLVLRALEPTGRDQAHR